MAWPWVGVGPTDGFVTEDASLCVVVCIHRRNGNGMDVASSFVQSADKLMTPGTCKRESGCVWFGSRYPFCFP